MIAVVSDCGYHLYLHECLLGKFLDSESAACRERSGEIFGIHLIHRSEEAHVGQKYSCLHYIGKSGSTCLKYSLGVLKALAGLAFDAFSHSAVGRIDGKLT